MSSYLVSFWPYPRDISPLPELVLVAGETVLDGTDFRNSAHLRFKADMFVPCGGRYVIPHAFEASIDSFPRM